MRPTQAEKARAFRALHEGEPFVVPNPWDAGSAKVLEALGFKTLATTSSGFAFTLGRPDGSVGLDELTEHVRTIADATALPVSVDLENGFGAEPEAASRAIVAAAGAGADVLYAPGLSSLKEIRAVCDAVGRPVNVLARPDLSLGEVAEAGGRRISVGGSLAWTAVEAMATVAERMRDDGDFSGLASPGRIKGWLAG